MLRLGFYQLNPVDIAVMQLILASAAQKLSGWEVVNIPPYDILVVDARAPILDRPAAKIFVKKFLKVSEPGFLLDNSTLSRPLMADQVEEWLTKHYPAITQVYRAPRILDTPNLNVNAKFKLLRWPPYELLQNDAYRTKIATLLTRHAMSANQLAGVAHLPILACIEFLKILKSLDLVCAVSSAQTHDTTPASNVRNSAPKVNLGFLARIRVRLGI